MAETQTENKEWVDIPSKSGIWKAVEPGDQIEGTYISKRKAPYRGRPNWQYCFESDDPLAVDGKISFFGTEGLNGALEDKLIGYKLRIIYKGERPSADKMKKPFKVFQVQGLFAPSDPLYKEYKGENEEEDETPPSSSNNALAGDELAVRCIGEITDDLITDRIEVTEDKIKEKAKEYHMDKLEGYSDPKILGRIEKELQRKG